MRYQVKRRTTTDRDGFMGLPDNLSWAILSKRTQCAGEEATAIRCISLLLI